MIRDESEELKGRKCLPSNDNNAKSKVSINGYILTPTGRFGP